MKRNKTVQETWAWNKICKGEVADFNKILDPYYWKFYSQIPDPRDPVGWTESRILRLSFLETILLNESYRSVLTRHGVRIIGAWFTDPFDLGNFTLDHQLWMDGCRFEKEVILFGAKIGELSITGSKFNGKLDMDKLEVKGSLLMRDGAEFDEVDLGSAKIGGQLVMNGSKFNGNLNMIGLEVQSDLIMSDGAEFDEVVLRGAKIGGTLYMTRSKFNGTLDMKRLEVKRDLSLTDNLEIITPIPVNLIFAVIGGNLDLSGSNLNSLDLTGIHVEREFHLESEKHPAVNWEKGSKLTLRNAYVGTLQTLQDLSKAWPDELELDGFIYARLGGLASHGASDIIARETSWFKKWLGKQDYSPQPYEQLARVLTNAGYSSKASNILYIGRECERNKETNLSWVWLTILKYSIGYGYRNYYAICWVLFFVILGWLILWLSELGKGNGIGIAYSLDMLLPIIKLSESHYNINFTNGWVRWYFYFQQIIGYILALFLIAGLSGLTKSTK